VRGQERRSIDFEQQIIVDRIGFCEQVRLLFGDKEEDLAVQQCDPLRRRDPDQAGLPLRFLSRVLVPERDAMQLLDAAAALLQDDRALLRAETVAAGQRFSAEQTVIEDAGQI
jgi:hypothetical protein